MLWGWGLSEKGGGGKNLPRLACSGDLQARHFKFFIFKKNQKTPSSAIGYWHSMKVVNSVARSANSTGASFSPNAATMGSTEFFARNSYAISPRTAKFTFCGKSPKVSENFKVLSFLDFQTSELTVRTNSGPTDLPRCTRAVICMFVGLPAISQREKIELQVAQHSGIAYTSL